jgi:hypothetical protein
MTRWDNSQPVTEQEFIEEQIEDHLARLFTAMPARVQRYDATLQVCDLVPLVRHPRKDPDGGYTHEDYPVLPCVPVVFPRTGDHFIAFALQPGDMGLVVFCKEAIGHWRVGDGDVTDPGMVDQHNISNGVFLPGLFHRGKKLRNAPEFSPLGGARLVIGSDADDGTRLSLLANGVLRVTRGAETAFQIDPDRTVHLGGAPAATKPLAVAELVDALAQSLKNHIATWVPVPTDGGASLKAHIAAWSPPAVASTKTRGL